MQESNVPISTKSETEMIQIAKEMGYTREELDVSIEVLQFLSKCGFDLIPQYITEMILDKISKESFKIPGLNLNHKNIHLRNGNFGEKGAKKTALNLEAKINLVKFVNKAICGYIDVPLKVENYTKGKSHIEKDKFLAFCNEQGLIIDIEKNIWDHHKIVQNLKSNTTNYSNET